MLRLAYSLLGDPAEAEDVMQDVMVHALTHLERYEPERAAFSTWLHVLTLNRCRDRARRRARGLRRLGDWLRMEPRPAPPDPEAGIQRIDAQAEVSAALRRLTPRQREAIVLREVEGLTFAEMADVLGVPLRTAQARVTSAHAAMRRALAREADDGGQTGHD